MIKMSNRTRSAAVLLAVCLLTFPPTVPIAEAQTLSYLDIDLTGTLNTVDYPYGITYDGSGQYVWMTLYKQGSLVKIDKDTKAYTFYHRPGAGASNNNFYSAITDPSGNVWVADRDNGLVWRFDPVSETWTSICVTPAAVAPVEKLGCTSWRVNENPGSHGIHNYVSGTKNWGIIYHGGYIWAAGSYVFDFDSQAEAVGAVDMVFSGLYRIDTSTLAVTSIPIGTGTETAGLVGEGDAIYVTDRLGKMFRYTVSNGIVDEIVIGLDNPFMVVSDGTYVYVSLWTSSGTSKIARILPSDGSTTIIDTGATIDPAKEGTYGLYYSAGLLFFSDLSHHIGYVSTSTLIPTVVPTTTPNNHFMTKVGDQIWFAGKGSAKIIQMDIPSGHPGGGSPLPGEEPYTPPATVTLSANVSAAVVGAPILLNGTVSHGGTVEFLTYYLSGAFGGSIGQTESVNGTYTFVWTPTQGGTFVIKALLLAGARANISPAVTVSVRDLPPPPPPPPPEPLSGIVTFGSSISNVSVDLYRVSISNNDIHFGHSATVYIQVKDARGVVIYIGGHDVMLEAAGDFSEQIVVAAGMTVEVFVWNGTMPLAEKASLVTGGIPG